MKYIALLRGINVGGKNQLSMKDLKELLEKNGFSDVETYINSGNILFSSEHSTAEQLKKSCEALIFEKFGLEISVMVLAAAELIETLNHAPDWWGADKESKHNALFVIPPATAEEVMKEVGEAKPEYEKVESFGKVIFWSAPIKTFSRTRWSKIVGKPVYHEVTIRNANTVKNLAQRCREEMLS